MNWLHEVYHWAFIGNTDETFWSLWQNIPHMLWEQSMNVADFLLALLIFRPIGKLWYARTKNRMHTELHDELDAELGIAHGTDHDHKQPHQEIVRRKSRKERRAEALEKKRQADLKEFLDAAYEMFIADGPPPGWGSPRQELDKPKD